MSRHLPDGETPAPELAFAAVVQWKEIHGHYSTWKSLVDDVSRLSGLDLVGLATHWGALLYNVAGDYRPGRQAEIVSYLASPTQLEEINRAIRARGRQPRPTPFQPPIINRQQLLILMRLALQHGNWDGTGEGLTGPPLLDLLLRINDHFDDVTPQRAHGADSIFDRIVAFPMVFMLTDLHHQRYAEGGVARSLTMLRQIQPLAATDPMPVSSPNAPETMRR